MKLYLKAIEEVLINPSNESFFSNKSRLKENIDWVFESFFNIIRSSQISEANIACDNIIKLINMLNVSELEKSRYLLKDKKRILLKEGYSNEKIKRRLEYITKYLDNRYRAAKGIIRVQKVESKKIPKVESKKGQKVELKKGQEEVQKVELKKGPEEVQKKTPSFELCYNIIFIKQDLNSVKILIKKTNGISLLKDGNSKTLLELLVEEYLKVDRDDTEKINYYEEVIGYFFTFDRDNADDIFFNKISKSMQDSEALLRLNNLREEIISPNIDEKIDKLCAKYFVSFEVHESIIEEMNGFTLDNSCRYHINVPFFTIDSEAAPFLDDAFAIEERLDGSYYLYIAISDIPSFIPYDSLTSKEAIRRCETLYLPDCTNEMYYFPSIKKNLSLDVGRERNAIVYRFLVDSNFNIDSDSMVVLKSRIEISQNLTFGDVNHDKEIILPQNVEMIDRAECIASNLKSGNPDKEIYRKLEHAVSSNDEYHHSVFAHEKRSAKIIEEFMLLVGRSIASLADREGWIYIHRNLVYPPGINYNGIMSIINNPNIVDEETIKYIRDNILCAYYDLENKGHAGLKYSSYSHSTAPGRRAIDGLNQYLLYQQYFNRYPDRVYYELEGHIKDIIEEINNRKRQNLIFTEEYRYLVKVRKRKKD